MKLLIYILLLFTTLAISVTSCVTSQQPNRAGSDLQKDRRISIETHPMFPGGEAAMMRFIRESIEYPVDALRNNIQGIVYVELIVEPDGSLSNVHVIKSVQPLLDEAAVAVIRKMPKWIPGTNNGEPVKVRVSLPVKFRIHEEPKQRKP